MTPERTCVIIKPDAIHRNLLGEIIRRLENKGLKIVGMKMMEMKTALLEAHYAHHKDKPFFESLKHYMQSSPVVVLALSGFNAIEAVRLIVGPTQGYKADAGSIRGDFSISGQANIVHASDSQEGAEAEIRRFFSQDELFSYERINDTVINSADER